MSLHIKDICNQIQINTILKWIHNFKSGNIKPLYIYGKSSVGKTTLANIILEQHNYIVINLTSLYINNHKNIVSLMDSVLNIKSISMMFEKPIESKGLIIDDLQHFIEYERNIYTEVDRIIKNIKKYKDNPLIIISDKISNKIHKYLVDKCVFIHIKQSKKKIHDMTRQLLIDEGLYNDKTMNDKTMNDLIINSNYNYINIKEKIKFYKNNKIIKNMSSMDISIDNYVLEYIKDLFNTKYSKDTIRNIYSKTYSELGFIILTLLENSLKYTHNSTIKNYNQSIKTICNIYKHISISDNYEYINIMNNIYNNNYIILHGIVYPIYLLHLSNIKKKQYSFKNTSIYSKSIIEVYNNKRKILFEADTIIKNIDNFISIYYHSFVNNDTIGIDWCENKLKDNLYLENEVKKYIKYIIYKVYNCKIK